MSQPTRTHHTILATAALLVVVATLLAVPAVGADPAAGTAVLSSGPELFFSETTPTPEPPPADPLPGETEERNTDVLNVLAGIGPWLVEQLTDGVPAWLARLVH